MGRIYTVEFEAVAVTAQVDFFELTPADDKPLELVQLVLTQSTELGDAAEEQLRFRVIRGHATSGSGGAASTPAPLAATGQAAGFTAETNNTTIASAGTAVNLWSETFNVRSGLDRIWLPDARPGGSQASLLVVRLMAAPADSITFSGTLVVEEYG